MHPKRACRVIEPLEPRYLLAVYTGTGGADTVVIFSEFGTNTLDITLNGTTSKTTDGQITINTLGGDDIIYAIGFADGINQPHAFTINLGDGNDEFTNVNSGGGQRSLDRFTASSTINDGAGDDSVVLDDSDGSEFKSYTFDSNALGYDFDTHHVDSGQDGSISYSSTLENFSVTGSKQGGTFNLNDKPASLNVSVFGQSGSDDFDVGGGDLDSNGWSNVILDGGHNSNNNFDIINFDDTADTYNSGETETYTLSGSSLDKGPVNISYTNFAAQTLKVSNTGSASPAFGQTVNLNAASMTTSILAMNRFCVVNVGTNSLGAITGDVHLGLDGADYANINDQSSSGDKTYTFAQHSLYDSIAVSPGPLITFSDADVYLNANTGNDTILVQTQMANDGYFINAGDGNDTITVGDGTLGDLDETVSVSGGTGTDSLIFDNSSDTNAESQTLSSTSFAQGSQSFNFDSVESMNIKEGPGGDSTNLNVVPFSTTVTGNTGGDFVDIGAGNLDTNLLGNVTFNGGAGTDQVLVDNRLATADGNYTITGAQIKKGSTFIFKTVNVSGVESETVRAGSGDDTISITGVSVPVSIAGGGGNDSITASNSNDVSVDTGSQGIGTGDQLVVNPSGTSATMKLNIVDTIGSIMTSVGGTLQITSHGIAINAHDLTLNGVIDLAGGAMIVKNVGSQTTNYHAYILGGYNNGTWTGTTSKIGKVTFGAINSSLAAMNPNDFAVGFAPASAIFTTFPATFLGQSIASADMLLRYTVQGDANLDGKTNALDFNALATNFGAAATDWYQGDFNYDHTVDTADFTMLAAHFNASLPSRGQTVDQLANANISPSLFGDHGVSKDFDRDVLT